MNTWDIISQFGKLQLNIPELMNYINMGYGFVGSTLYPLFQSDLTIEIRKKLSDGDTLWVPHDLKTILEIRRETENGSAEYRPCTPVDPSMKSRIGNDPKYPITERAPYYIHEGKKLLIYPDFPVAETEGDGVWVLIEYQRRLAELVFGTSKIGGSDTDKLILDTFASNRDDIYNDHDLAIYHNDGRWRLYDVLTITDYDGSTKECTFDDVAEDLFKSGTTYRYALYPYIPNEYHSLIVDAARIELAKAGLIEAPGIAESLSQKFEIALKMGGR